MSKRNHNNGAVIASLKKENAELKAQFDNKRSWKDYRIKELEHKNEILNAQLNIVRMMCGMHREER